LSPLFFFIYFGMNILQMFNLVAFFNDREQSARFPDESYIKAINSAIIKVVEDRLDNIKSPKKYSFESVQRVRDELYTLVPPTLTIVPVGDTIPYPADYNYFLKLECTIDGETHYSKPTSYGESGTLSENPFKAPSAVKTYFDQNVNGFYVYRGGTSFTAGLLDYIKHPDAVSVGNESNQIVAGASVLTIGTTYIVYEDAVHNGVSYVMGDTFVAVSVILTSGIVILNSLMVSCDLPKKIHEEVCRVASAIMNGSVSDFEKTMALKIDNKE